MEPFAVGTRAAGLERLAAFAARAGAYGRERNYDRGPGGHTAVSGLSPFLRHRLVLEEEAIAAVLERYAPSTVEKFIDEVFWRAYFKGYLERHPFVWAAYREALARDLEAARRDRALSARLDAAMEGRTGIEPFDAWAEELVGTGYVHNHARMWFASIWIFTLGLPWTLGADFFYRHLLDGDPASNTLSWRWVAGLHTRGKTYLARPDNIARYTEGRFRPTGLAPTAPPLEEPPLPATRPVPPAAESVDGEPCLLLLTEEDLSPERGPLSDVPAVAVAGASSAAARTGRGASGMVLSFTGTAVEDGLARARDHYGVPACRLPDLSLEPLVEAARTAGVSRIVTAYAPVGPVRGRLKTLKRPLGEAGIALATVRRPGDGRAWAFADRGFFKVKKRIPDLLESLFDEAA